MSDTNGSAKPPKTEHVQISEGYNPNKETPKPVIIQTNPSGSTPAKK